MKKLPILLLTLLLLGGFSLHQKEHALVLKTHRLAYEIGVDETIKIIVENNSPWPIYYNKCMGKRLLVVEEEEVVRRFGFRNCRSMETRILSPGGWRAFTLPLRMIKAYIEKEGLVLSEGQHFRVYLVSFKKGPGPHGRFSEEELSTNDFMLTSP